MTQGLQELTYGVEDKLPDGERDDEGSGKAFTNIIRPLLSVDSFLFFFLQASTQVIQLNELYLTKLCNPVVLPVHSPQKAFLLQWVGPLYCFLWYLPKLCYCTFWQPTRLCHTSKSSAAHAIVVSHCNTPI
jgi:hypothetical protein